VFQPPLALIDYAYYFAGYFVGEHVVSRGNFATPVIDKPFLNIGKTKKINVVTTH